MSNQTGVVKIVLWMYFVIFVKMIVDDEENGDGVKCKEEEEEG